MLTRPLTWLDAAPESWPGSCGCALGVCALQRPRSPQGCPRDHSRGSAFPPFCLAFRVGSTRTAPGLVWFPSPLFLHSLPGPLPHTPATAQASGAGQQERETENAGGPSHFWAHSSSPQKGCFSSELSAPAGPHHCHPLHTLQGCLGPKEFKTVALGGLPLLKAARAPGLRLN